MLRCMPVGFRFQPTEEEPVDYYLKNKLNGHDSLVHIIPVIDMCKVEPWNIPGTLSVIKSEDPEWYFFSRRDYKYANGGKSNRATKSGFWKGTGVERNINGAGTGNVIGAKKTLVFHKGRAPHAIKTTWVIHEYHATTFPDSRVYTSSEVNSESMFQPPPHAEEYPSSWIQQSSVDSEQEPFIPNSICRNAYFSLRNENNNILFPCETTEEKDDLDEFVNSMLVV